MFNWSVIKEAGRKAVVYLMLFVMSFNTVACNMETDTKVPASLTVSPEPGLHEYPFDGTGGVSGQVQTISGSYVAMDGSTSMSVKFEFPEGITVQSNEGNGFASFIFDAPGYYIIKAHAMYNGKAAITQEIHYSITSTLTALGLKTNKDDASIGTTLRMTKGETLTLIPVYTPASSGTLGVEWEIDESNGVISTQEVENQSSIPPYQVEKQLKVTALAEGSTTIKATSVDNSEISKEITVVVSATMTDQSTNPTYITISNPEKTEVELGETVTLSATVYDGYNNPVSGQTVEFVVEDEGVFEILEKTTNSVTLEAVGGGDSRIFAYLLDKDGSRVPGIDSYTTLSTIGAIEKLSITPYFGILLGGGDEVVNVEYYPANTFEKGFEVSIQNPKIVALVEQSDETFTLRPLSKGQTQITLTSTSDAGIKASATIVVDEELSNVERITKVAFDESVLNFTSMASQTIKAHTYVRNLQGVVETDDSLGLKFTNKNPEIISIHQEESTPNTLTITPVRPTKENEKAIVEVRSTENDNFYDELTVYVEGDLVRLVPATSSVDLLMGTDGGYDIVPYPENAVFALDSESDKDGKAVVSIDVSNTDSIKNARLEREGNALRLYVSAGSTPGVSTIAFLKDGENVGSMDITTTVADDYVKSIRAERGNKVATSISLAQDADPVSLNVRLINGNDEAVFASESAYDYSVSNNRVIDVSREDSVLTISPKNAGEAYITLTATANSKAKTEIYVEVGGSAVQGDTLRNITLSKDSSSLTVDRSDTVNYTIIPYSIESETSVTAQIEDPEIASVTLDQKAKQATIVGLKTGTTDITFTASHDNVVKTAKFKLTVKESGDYYSIILDRDYLSYDLNQKAPQTITATVYKNGSVDNVEKVNWKVEDESIGSITPTSSSKGRSAYVGYASKVGTTRIIASLDSDPSVTASTVLEVIDSKTLPTTIRNIVLNQSAITIPLGRSSQIGYSIVPSELDGDAIVTFASDNEAVASVDESGVISTHSIGDATITATVDMSQTDGKVVRDTMSVNVVRDTSQPSYISLSQSSVTLDQEKMDEGVSITASVYDRDDKIVDGANVEWGQSISSRKIVRVEESSDNSVTLYPISAGRTTISVKYPGVATVYLQVVVGEEVTNAKAVETLRPNVNKLDMFLENDNGKTFNVYVTPVPADVTNDLEIEWSSTAAGVATVTQNTDHPMFATIRATGTGNAQIIAKVKDTSIQAVIDVSVTQNAPDKVTAIEVSPASIIFDLNSRKLTQIKATVYYNGAPDESQDVEWTVDSALTGAVVTEASDGQYLRISKGNKTGEGYITATAGDKSAATAVEVVASSTDVSLLALNLSSSNISINQGQKTIVYANPYPSTVAEKSGYTIAWSSTDDEIATVNGQGVITGVSSGSAQIEAKASYNGVQKSAIVNVRVYGDDDKPSYIALSDPSVVLNQEKMDEATEVTATVYGRNNSPVDNAEVTWSISSYGQRFVRMEADGNTARLYPVSAGSASITVSYPNIPSVTLLVTVGAEVENAKGVKTLVPSTNAVDLWLSDSTGRSFDIYVTPVPADVSSELDIEWSTSNRSVVTVSPNSIYPTAATINATGTGSATIAAKIKDTSIQTTFDVNVTQSAPNKVTAIEVNPSSIVFDLNSRELTELKATVYYNGVADNTRQVEWAVDKTLDGAVVTGGADGQYLRISKGSKTGAGFISATSGDKTSKAYVSTIDSATEKLVLTSLSLSATSLDLGIGQKSVVYATPYPTAIANETDYSITWTSSDEDIVIVDEGYLTGVSNGVATVSATASYGGVQKTARLSVRVSDEIDFPSQIVFSPSSLKFASSSSSAADVSAMILMNSGSEYTLLDGEEISYSINDSSVVEYTPSQKGTKLSIAPAREGNAVITASFGTLSANLNVEVGSSVESPATAPTKLTLNSSTGGIMNPPGSASDTTTIISVEYLPQNLANEYKGVSWSLDSESHAKILFSNEHTATLQAVAPGKAVLTASSLANADVKASISVTVLDEEIVIPRISLDRSNINMDLTDSVTVNALVTRNGMTDESGTVTFTNDSSDKNISFETVGSRGYTITTDTEQTSTFTVTASYPVGVGDNVVTAMLPVTVEDPSVEGQPLREVVLSEDSLVMAVGEIKDLDYSVEPKVAVTAQWKTSNPDIVTVDQNGIVEAVATGNAEVSVEVTDEFGITLSDAVRISVTDEIRESSRFSSLEASETAITRNTRDLPYQFTLTLTDSLDKVDTQTEITEVKAYGVDGQELKNGDLFKWTLIGKPARTVELSDFKPGSAYLRFTVLDDVNAEGQKAGVSTSVFVNITGDVKGISADTQYLHMAVGDSEEIKISYSPTTAIPETNSVSWTIEDSQLASGTQGDVVEILDATANSATVKALALGSATVKVSYGTELATTLKVSVEDIASLSGGIKKITFDEGFLELGYPYTRTEVGATVHFYDGTTTTEGIRYTWKEPASASIANILAPGNTCYIVPVADGEATLVATYGSNNNLRAELQVFVKGSISELTPSANTMTIYTGGSVRVSVSPDIEDIPNTQYGWRVVKEEKKIADGTYVEIGNSDVSALTNILTDPNDDNSTVVIAAKSVITDEDNSRYDATLVESYPRKVTVESYLVDKPSVSTEMTVMVELLPVNNSYPTELKVDFSKLANPDLESYNTVTGALLDSNGNEIDGHIDWYYYALGDDSWDEAASETAAGHETTSWINPSKLNDTLDVLAYTEENAKTLYLKPQKYGIYRLKAICRENPQLQQSTTINIEGEVKSIIDSAGGSLDITENGDWVTITATFDPEPVLKRDAFFVLGSYKTQSNGSSTYNEDKNMKFIVNGNSIQIFGKAVTSEPMPLFIEYWDAATRENLEKVANNEMSYDVATEGGTLIATKTVMVRVVPKSKSIATISVSGLDISIDPSSISGPINFNVAVSGGQWGNAGSESDNTFKNWEWLEVDIIGSDSANAGQDVIYASTTPSRVNAPASIAQGGRINLVNGTASFTLVKNAIPNEPLMVRVDLKDDYQDGVINNGENGPTDGTVGTVVFDNATLGFNKYESIVYIGGQVTNLNAGTTEFTNNGTTDTATGQVINMITGAMATIKVEYNPSYTHQKGTIWYTPDVNAKDRLDYSYINNGNTNECSVDGASVSNGPVVLRAMSIYDPWFDYRAEQLNMTTEEFRSKFLSQSHEARLSSSTYRYPNSTDKTQPTIYLDFQVTVSSPIDKAIFTAKAQRQTNKDTGQYPTYAYMNDQTNHPDVVSESDIYCYDTSDASGASEEGGSMVDAYYIIADLLPDYGYSLTYSVIEGKNIGTIDAITDIDEGENAFRFIPKGRTLNPDGTYSVAYGDVVIRATAAEQNFTQDFRLHYLPSNMRVVKYVGEKSEGGLEVPADKWVDEWDVVKTTGENKSLYGMEAIVLQQKGVSSDPNVSSSYTSFPFSVVSFSDNKPYYITNGAKAQEAEGGEILSRYAVKFTLMQGKEVSGEEWKSNIAHFESPTGEDLGNETEFLTFKDLNEPYISVVADKQGVAYISYTIISVDENGVQIPSSGSMAGGVMLYIISPMNQALAALINEASNATSYTYAALIPEKISKAQDDLWFLGPTRGQISEVALTAEGQESGQYLRRGRIYASFTLPAGESISGAGTAFNTRTEFKSMKELGQSSGNPSISLEINTTSVKELAIKDGSVKIGEDPKMNDVIITGPTGLSLLNSNGITSLSISDETNGLYKSNIISGVLDLSNLKSLKVYQHEDMDISNEKFTIKLPSKLETFTLKDCNFDGTINWNGSNATLTSIDLSGNSFKTTALSLSNFSKLKTFYMENSAPKEVKISNAPVLEEISVDSSKKISSASSKLTTTSTPKLTEVDANNTQFTDISVAMSKTVSVDNEIDLGSNTTGTMSKLKTLKVTSGYVDTIRAQGAPVLTTIDAGGCKVDTISILGSPKVAKVTVDSIGTFTKSTSNTELAEFSWNTLEDGARIDLQEMSKLTSIGKDKNSSFSYNVPAGTELLLGSGTPAWELTDPETSEYGPNSANRSNLVTVNLGQIDGRVDLQNAKSLDVLKSGKGSGTIDANNSGLKNFAGKVSTGVKTLILDYSRALEGDVEINGGVNESIEELSMNYCPITSISITASSQLQILSAYSCALENAELLGTKLRKLDVHDNQLGGGKLYVGNIKYENHSLASGSYDWQDNGVLEYICAYDNDIYHAMSIPRDTHGKVTYTFRLGCDIPDSVAVGWRDFKVTSEGYKGGGTHYHIGSYSNNGYSGGKHGPGNSRRTYYNNGTVLKSQITQQAGDMLEAQAYWRSGDWYSNSGSARFYPFGQ